MYRPGNQVSLELSPNHVVLHTWGLAGTYLFLMLVPDDSSLLPLIGSSNSCLPALALFCKSLIEIIAVFSSTCIDTTLWEPFTIVSWSCTQLSFQIGLRDGHTWIIFNVHLDILSRQMEERMNPYPHAVVYPNAPLFVPSLQGVLKSIRKMWLLVWPSPCLLTPTCRAEPYTASVQVSLDTGVASGCSFRNILNHTDT